VSCVHDVGCALTGRIIIKSGEVYSSFSIMDEDFAKWKTDKAFLNWRISQYANARRLRDDLDEQKKRLEKLGFVFEQPSPKFNSVSPEKNDGNIIEISEILQCRYGKFCSSL
jgi:hypothetical protein